MASETAAHRETKAAIARCHYQSRADREEQTRAATLGIPRCTDCGRPLGVEPGWTDPDDSAICLECADARERSAA